MNWQKITSGLCIALLTMVAASRLATPVLATQVKHEFFIILPNGTRENLNGTQVRTGLVENGGGDIDVAIKETASCSGNNCSSTASCDWMSFHAPYLPEGYDASDYYKNFLRSKDPSIQYVGGIRGFANTFWKGQIIGQADGGQFQIISKNMVNLSEMFEGDKKRQAEDLVQAWSQINTTDPNQPHFYKDGNWNAGAGNPNQEIAYDDVGGNQLHGTVSWTLQLPSTPSSPRCENFTLYKGDTNSTIEIPADGTIEKTGTITVKHANKSADGALDSQRLCWSAKGLTGDQYQTGRSVFACVYTCSQEANEEGQLVGPGDVLKGSAPNLTTACTKKDASGLVGSVTGSVDAFIAAIPDSAAKEAAQTNGLFFTQDAMAPSYPTDKKFCGTNPGNTGVETGLLYVNGAVIDTASQCGVSPAGNCSRRVTYAAPPTQPVQCVGISGFPAFGQVDVNTNTTLTCTTVEGATRYEFRIQKPDGTWDNINPSPNGVKNSSVAYSMTATGSYTAQCRPCKDASADSCSTWGATAACSGSYSTNSAVITPICKATEINKTSFTKGTTEKVSITCRSIPGVKTYKVTYPSNTAAGAPAEAEFDADAAGNGTYEFAISNLNDGAYNVSCVPCTAESCATATNLCKTAFSVSSLGQVSCTSKTAYRVDTVNGTETLTELANNAVVARNSVIQYVVTLATNKQPAKSAVTLKDSYNATAMKINPSSFNPATWITAASGAVNMTVPAAEIAGNASLSLSYRMTVNDLPQPTSIPNTVAITNDGQGGQTPNACSFTLRRAAQGEATCQSKTAYYVDASNQNIRLTSSTTASSYVDPGQEFFYEIKIAASEQTSGPITVVDTLPTRLDFVNVSLDKGTAVTTPTAGTFFDSRNGQQLKFVIPAFGSTGTATEPEIKSVVMKVKVKTDATPGDVANAVSIGTNGATPVNAPACANTLRVPPNGVAKCVSKTVQLASGGNVLAPGTTQNTGTELLYTVNVRSTTLTAGDVLVTDQVPASLEVTDKGDFATFNASTGLLSSTLPPFTGTKSLKFKAKIKTSASSGNITNVAVVKTKDRSGNFVDTNGDACNVVVAVPSYTCNSSCSSNDQCKSVNNDYVCSASAGSKCRLDSNQSSESCQPLSFACNSRCETDANCQSVNPNYVCYDAGGDTGKVCRLNSNNSASNCAPPASPTPTPTPTVGCNSTCVNNADCTNPNHVCFDTGSGMKCRLANNVSSVSCTLPGTAAPQPVTPAELPQSGPANWSNWLKGGLVVIGVGALLLLLI